MLKWREIVPGVHLKVTKCTNLGILDPGVLAYICQGGPEEPPFLVDTGSVLDVFSLRDGTDFDLVFDQRQKESAAKLTKIIRKQSKSSHIPVWQSVSMLEDACHLYCLRRHKGN